MRKTLKIICEKTGNECILTFEMTKIHLAGGISTEKLDKWHCSERQKNNIVDDCACNKELRKVN